MGRTHTMLKRIAYGVTLLVVGMAAVFPAMLGQEQVQMVAGVIMLLGIPHGATDHLIFERLSQPFLGAKKRGQFYSRYLMLVFVYALVWWAVPIAALIFFLLISAYHFGQSNWTLGAVTFPNRTAAALAYWSSGCFTLFFPLVWQYEEAASISSKMVGETMPVLSLTWRSGICCMLLIVNVLLLIYWNVTGCITRHRFWEEIIHLMLLSLLFAFVPLLLGFVIYFVFWHALSSIIEQIQFFQSRSKKYNWRQYVQQAIPLSGIAVGGLLVFVWLKNVLALPSGFSLLFIFIAIITLPHMLLIEQLYEEWKKEDTSIIVS